MKKIFMHAVAAVRLVPIVVVLEPVHFTTDITVTVRLDLEAEDELAINITVPLTTINGTAGMITVGEVNSQEKKLPSLVGIKTHNLLTQCFNPLGHQPH